MLNLPTMHHNKYGPAQVAQVKLVFHLMIFPQGNFYLLKIYSTFTIDCRVTRDLSPSGKPPLMPSRCLVLYNIDNNIKAMRMK